MPDIIFYSFCLTSAFLYSVSGLCLKQAMAKGAGPIRTTFVMTAMLVLVFFPLTFLSDRTLSMVRLWQPMLAGMVSFFGSLATVSAIRWGDVTIQAPMMGIKIVFVAFITILMSAGPVPLPWWIAAFLAALAVFILGWSGIRNRRSLLLTACFALLASLFYATEDVMIQKWAPAYGPYWYIFMLMVSQMVFSFILVPFFRWNLTAIPGPAWPWLLIGTLLMGIQGVLFYVPISLRGEATVVNIVYSSRGIWSILLVWFVGSWFGNTERHAGRKIMIQRLIGALLLLVAIALVLLY